VTVYRNPTLVIDLNTGAHVTELQKADGDIYGLGVIEGHYVLFFLNLRRFRPKHLRVPRHAAAPPLQATRTSASAA
jgi:hypothetical protein